YGAGEAGAGPQSSAEEEGDVRRLHARLDGVCPRSRDRRHPALCRQGRLPPSRELPQTQKSVQGAAVQSGGVGLRGLPHAHRGLLQEQGEADPPDGSLYEEEPRKVCFNYDLFLNLEGNPPVNHLRCEKLTFNNPTKEFRRKLIKAGGVRSHDAAAARALRGAIRRD
ncbi:unnamed protein product, partial [Tetraodon nigroviridis]